MRDVGYGARDEGCQCDAHFVVGAGGGDEVDWEANDYFALASSMGVSLENLKNW